MSYTNKHAGMRNAAIVTRTVTATLTTVPEGAGWMALGNYMYVRNVN